VPGAAVAGYAHALPVTIAFAAPFAFTLSVAVPLALDQPAPDQSAREPYRQQPAADRAAADGERW
jgi:hypothetical protein